MWEGSPPPPTTSSTSRYPPHQLLSPDFSLKKFQTYYIERYLTIYTQIRKTMSCHSSHFFIHTLSQRHLFQITQLNTPNFKLIPRVVNPPFSRSDTVSLASQLRLQAFLRPDYIEPKIIFKTFIKPLFEGIYQPIQHNIWGVIVQPLIGRQYNQNLS